MASLSALTYLTPEEWKPRHAAHVAAAEERLARFRHPGGYHPVYDFLFEYYPIRPSHLTRWHPASARRCSASRRIYRRRNIATIASSTPPRAVRPSP